MLLCVRVRVHLCVFVFVIQVALVSTTSRFPPFQVQPGMTLAPILRRDPLRDTREFDQALQVHACCLLLLICRTLGPGGDIREVLQNENAYKLSLYVMKCETSHELSQLWMRNLLGTRNEFS